MISKYLCMLSLSCFTIFSLYSNETPQDGQLSSTEAAYDGSALKLSGHVVLDHGLGKMTAEEAMLQRQESGKDFPFSLIELKKEVLLSLASSGKLMCDEAQLDFSSLKGVLSAPLKGLVTYSDQIQKKGKEQQSLCLKSPSIELDLNKVEQSTKAEYDIRTILAKDGVVAEYNKDFILQADRALYRKMTDELQGVVSAYPKDSQSTCSLTHGADSIEAKEIDLDTISSVLSFHKATGHIASSFITGKESGRVRIASDLIIWDDVRQTLSLKGASEVIEPSLGTITTQHELAIQQAIVDGKKAISHVESKGPSILTYKDTKTGANHKISSHGCMKIDRDTLSAQLTSPVKKGAKLPLAEQVFYEEMKMGVHADSASIEFSEEGDKMEPVSFALKGNVTLFSRDTGEPFRCAIADRMSYNPATKTLILSSTSTQKVLFWDEQQAVRMSAEEVHLTQSGATQQTVIQGVGNVKFTLSTEENEALRKFFPQYKPQP